MSSKEMQFHIGTTKPLQQREDLDRFSYERRLSSISLLIRLSFENRTNIELLRTPACPDSGGLAKSKKGNRKSD